MKGKKNSNGNGRIVESYERLINVALSLSREKDPGRLLETILDEARATCRADAGTLYILSEEKRHLNFAIMQNETLKIRTRSQDEIIEYPQIPLYYEGGPNHANVSSYVALTGESVNVSDVYKDGEFDFEGPKNFDKKTGYHTSSMLVIPMKNHLDETLGVIQLLNAKDAQTGDPVAFSDQDAKIVSALASLASVVLTNTRLIENLYQDLDTIKKLKDNEDDLNKRLKEAFLDIEKSNKEMTAALRKVRVTRMVGGAVLLLFLIGAGAIYFYQRSSIQQERISRPAMTTMTYMGAVQEYVVTPQPVSSSVSLVGKLKPLKQVSIVSPFTGKVKEKYFEYGQVVKKGQLLLKMDIEELTARIRDATAKYIRASQNLRDIRNWHQSTEVAQAERSLARSRHLLDTAERKRKESKVLFDEGIISQVEYEATEEALRNAQLDLKSAEENLAATLKKGSPENVRVSEFELENARMELENLKEHLEMAEVISPVTGIILLPQAAGPQTKIVERGLSVNQGEMLVSVGDLEGYSVKCQVDEIDIGKIKLGQPVSVSGDAFPDLSLTGKITHASSQAASPEGFSQVPMFDITVTIEDLTPAEENRLRLGMSCNLQVQVYNNPNALMVPIHMVHTYGSETWVNVFQSGSVGIKKVPVKTGITTMDSVEIVSGLKAGNKVVMSGETTSGFQNPR